MPLDRSQAPQIHDAIDFDFILPAKQHNKLNNQIDLYWVNAGVQAVAQIDWVFPAGIWYEHSASVAQATAGLLKNGTSNYSAKQISEALEFYGAQLRVNAGNDFTIVTLYALTKHLGDLLPMVKEILLNARFPQEEVDIYKQNTLQRLLVSLRQCDFVANRVIDAVLFGEQHPYGRFSVEAKIAAISRTDLVTFHQKHYNLAHAKMFMAGKVGDAEVKLIDEIFGSVPLEHSNLVVPQYATTTDPLKQHAVAHDAQGVQGAIRIGRLFPNRHHPDYTPMVVLNTLFGGYFGSRLMSNIREDKGYTYGIHSSIVPEQHGGSLIIQTETGRDVTAAAVQEIYHEMEAIIAQPVDEEELLLVKNYLLGNILGDLDGPFSILSRWRSLILNGFPEEKFYENIAIYKSITPEELQALAKKYFNKADFHEVVVI